MAHFYGTIRGQRGEGERQMQKMTAAHLKRCQEIAEKTGGKELAAAIAFALAKRQETK